MSDKEGANEVKMAIMTTEEAINCLIYPTSCSQNQYNEAARMAIDALRREESTRKMLKNEKAEYQQWIKTNYKRGRISAFYDALGINYME